jgi:MFS superfamily sulfate permease-like transporter
VVIAAALSLFNIAVLRTYFSIRKSALVISLIASLGVILFGVLQGILIAIVLSILLFFRRSWWPEGEVLGRVHALEGWHRTDLFADAEEADGVVVYRWEAPLFFANAGIFRQEIRRLERRRKPRWIVLQCEAITDIDVTAADMLEKLDTELNDKGVNVVFVEMRSRIQDLLERYGLFATFTREHVYPSIDIAMREIRAEERSSGVDAKVSEEDLTDPSD